MKKTLKIIALVFVWILAFCFLAMGPFYYLPYKEFLFGDKVLVKLHLMDLVVKLVGTGVLACLSSIVATILFTLAITLTVKMAKKAKSNKNNKSNGTPVSVQSSIKTKTPTPIKVTQEKEDKKHRGTRF